MTDIEKNRKSFQNDPINKALDVSVGIYLPKLNETIKKIDTFKSELNQALVENDINKQHDVATKYETVRLQDIKDKFALVE